MLRNIVSSRLFRSGLEFLDVSQEDDVDLREYLRVLRRRWLLIVTCLLLGTAIGALVIIDPDRSPCGLGTGRLGTVRVLPRVDRQRRHRESPEGP